jgi:DNA mismatch repair ATPase MutS
MNLLIDKKIKERNNKIKEHFTSKKNINYEFLNINYIPKNIYLSDTVFNDIEFFSNFNKESKSKSVYDTIKTFSTLKGSKIILKNVLLNPLDNLNILKKRIDILNKYNNDDKNIWNVLNKNESNVLLLFEENEKYIEDLLNIVYFKFNIFNKSSHFLTSYNLYRILLSPLIGILSPIIYFVIPFLIFKIKLKLTISFGTYIKMVYNMLKQSLFGSGMYGLTGNFRYISLICNLFTIIFYFQGIFNSIEISKTVNSICKNIIERFNNALLYLKTAIEIDYLKDDELINSINEAYFNYDFCDYKTEKEYIDKLSIIDYNFLNNFGKQLVDYKNRNKKIIASLIVKTWFLDFIKTCNSFKLDYNCCFPKYIKTNNKSLTVFKDLKHPCLDSKKAVENDCKISNKNIILTGPNAGGKSTYIKSVLINVILSQTLCICSSSRCLTVPYSNIISQMNIPDCKGKESLFEAEMHRCLNTLNLLSSSKRNKFTLIIMDEIFNSTNPIEGISGAYSIIKKMGQYKNASVIFTTHYNYLTNLSKENFDNYKIDAIIKNNNITFPYKISKGISTQYIALELLKKNGFDSEIIEEAIRIKNELPKI